MTEQELRDEFEKWAIANFNIAPELISDFKYSFTHRLIHAETAFLKGYSLAQETIAELESRIEQSVDISVVNELNETIKAKDAEIERLKSTFAGYENFQREKQLEQELQKTREHLGKAIKSAEFFMSHADCKRDSWACKCSFCRDTESSKNLREARQYFQDKDKQGE